MVSSLPKQNPAALRHPLCTWAASLLCGHTAATQAHGRGWPRCYNDWECCPPKGLRTPSLFLWISHFIREFFGARMLKQHRVGASWIPWSACTGLRGRCGILALRPYIARVSPPWTQLCHHPHLLLLDALPSPPGNLGRVQPLLFRIPIPTWL